MIRALEDERKAKLNGVLRTLLDGSDDIEAAALVSMDGFVVASALSPDTGEDRVGAMTAALLSLGERITEELGRGELAQVFIEGTWGYVFILAAGEEALLAAVVRRGAKLGAVLHEIRRSVKDIAALIESDLQVEYE